MQKKVYIILTVLLAVIFIGSAAMLGMYYRQGQVQENRYEELEELLPTVQRPTIPDETIPDATIPEETVPEENAPETVTVDGREMLPRFAQLYQLNSDIVGWFEIPGTDISYPVMQTPSNPEYYLRHNFDKESSSHGCLFAQANADVFAPSDNITIYGHHMKDGSMFALLDKYKEHSFFEEHRYLYFDTLEATHTYQIIAVFKTSASGGFRYNEFVDAANEYDFTQFVNSCKELSLYDTGVDAVYGDKLITLSTCEYSQTNGRLVVVAQQVA